VSWNVLITARTLNVESVGKRALELLHGAGCKLVHPPRYGPLTEAELLSQLDGIDVVFASMDKFADTVLGSGPPSSSSMWRRGAPPRRSEGASGRTRTCGRSTWPSARSSPSAT
jgi:hypothetical protein